jgi:hypothetical protein
LDSGPEFGRRLVVKSICLEDPDELSLLFQPGPAVTAPGQMLFQFEAFASLKLPIQIGI